MTKTTGQEWPPEVRAALKIDDHKKQPAKRKRTMPAQLSQPPQPHGVIVIDVPLPDKSTHPNGRAHWRVKARHTATQRGAAKAATLIAIANRKDIKLPWPNATIDAAFFGVREKLADATGLESWLKATVDGISDVLNASQDHNYRFGVLVAESAREKFVRVTIRKAPQTPLTASGEGA